MTSTSNSKSQEFFAQSYHPRADSDGDDADDQIIDYRESVCTIDTEIEKQKREDQRKKRAHLTVENAFQYTNFTGMSEA